MKALVIGCIGLVGLMVVVLLIVVVIGFAPWGNSQVLTHSLSEPLNGATMAKVEIDAGSGNLTIDQLAGGEPVLASGTLQYFEKQGRPTRSVSSDQGRTTLYLKGASATQSGFRFPWEDCNGATEWQIHLNPTVSSDITAHTGGGNVKLNLAGLVLTRLAADAGGGNMDVILPENAANLDVAAKTGAGNVTVEIGSGTKGTGIVNANSGAGNVVVRVPSGIAAKIHATSGMGQVIVDSAFGKLDGKTYQSPDYDSAANRIEITVQSGAGNVTVNSK